MSEWITGKTPPPDQRPDKCIHGFTKCCTEKPYAATTKPDTTLRDEIKGWVRIMFGDRPESKDNDILDHYTDAILDLLAKRLPELEKLKKGDPYLESKVSYNQAILEVRAIIDGKDL